jgi:SpoVK/Ycf46/Vps4 family AAA+-type ATPase
MLDEGFEAELDPEAALRIPVTGSDGRLDPVRPDGAPRVTFQDVGGMATLKEQIRLKILYPFQQPHVYAAYGKKIGGGILLYGPPGCGKTYLARATAGELGARFYILSLDEILSMWIGQTEKQLSAIFETARSNAPAVLFIDEVDALGAKRSDIQNASIRMMVSQFLVEMDGIAAKNHQLLVLGATNAPWSIDPALRRPGRFDRILFVPPPDRPAREEILRLHARGRKIDPNMPWNALSEKTEMFSGADLEHLVEQATESALADALRSGGLRDVTVNDFRQALREVKASTVEWLRRARNYVNYSNQDGLYDDLSSYLDSIRMR